MGAPFVGHGGWVRASIVATAGAPVYFYPATAARRWCVARLAGCVSYSTYLEGLLRVRAGRCALLAGGAVAGVFSGLFGGAHACSLLGGRYGFNSNGFGGVPCVAL